MNELEQINSKVSDLHHRLGKHEGKVEKLLSEISESLQKISTVMVKQEVQEEAQKVDREDINQLKDKYHDLDKKADLSIQAEDNIDKTAKRIEKMLLGAFKWAAGIFGSLMIVLVVAAIKAFSQ